MLSFATEFPVDHSRLAADFVDAVRHWILGSPHTKLRPEDLSGIRVPGEWHVSRGTEQLALLGVLSSGFEQAAVRYTKSEGRLEWDIVIGFSRSSADSWTSVRVSCESTHAAARLPPAKKPVVVRTLLDKLGGARDGVLDVVSTPHLLEQVDVDFAARLMRGDSGCRLPIAYVSAGFVDNYCVDATMLAHDLAGMAHVVVEPNRAFSNRLKTEVDGQNVYGGTLGIYWPEGTGRRAFFLGPSYETQAKLHASVVDEIRSALVNRRPLDRCTWSHVQSIASRAAFDALKSSGSTEIDKYIEEFDREIEAKDEKLQAAESEIARLRAEVRKYESRGATHAELSIRTGREQDLYSGEIAEIVLDAISDAATRLNPESRRYHVLVSILEGNTRKHEMDTMRAALKELLRGSSSVDRKIRKGLEQMGFSITEGGKHTKIVFQGDERYTFALPKTGSDYRGGLNAAGDISRLLF